MVIGIDIRVLGSGRKSGVEEYTENLLSHMLPLDTTVQFKLFYSSYRTELPSFSWLALSNVSLFSFKISNRALLYTTRLFNRPFIDKKLKGVDVFFAPHFFSTALSPKVRRVTTFHDLSFEQFPEFFSRKQRLWHRFVSPAWQARFSDQLITVSDSTKQDLSSRYHIDPARITTIHSGVSATFRPLTTEMIEQFRHQHRLPEKFILFFGAFEPRKNLLGIIRAFEMTKSMPGMEQVHLVLAGAPGWLNQEGIAYTKHSSYANHIHILDQVQNDERTFLYNAATVFAYPSFFEGFGFPPLEAMACGIPVIASYTSSLPEVVGDAGILVNPYNLSEMAYAMHSAVTDVPLRTTLIERGLQRVQRFSWHRCAKETLDILTRS